MIDKKTTLTGSMKLGLIALRNRVFEDVKQSENAAVMNRLSQQFPLKPNFMRDIIGKITLFNESFASWV